MGGGQFAAAAVVVVVVADEERLHWLEKQIVLSLPRKSHENSSSRQK